LILFVEFNLSELASVRAISGSGRGCHDLRR
jgi:hypothetical protein